MAVTSTTTPATAPTTTVVATTAPNTATSTTTGTGSTAEPTEASAFVGTVAPVTAAQVSGTWRPGCPVGPPQLRLLTMSYWGFDGRPHTGTMVVNGAVTAAVLKVFDELFTEHFPIRQMQPEDVYGGHDPVSMADDNTSGFNCRYAVAPGPPTWSVHAYGEAIDVNPVENPYLEGGQVQPATGAAFVDRSPYRPGMAVPGGQLVEAFASVGWLWGGRWAASPDYQHFSATGG
jgi:D-alanyl-D-alanine carboxypeptidase